MGGVTVMDLLVCADCGSAYYDAPPGKDELRLRCLCPPCRPDRPEMTIRKPEVFGCPEAAKALTATWEV